MMIGSEMSTNSVVAVCGLPMIILNPDVGGVCVNNPFVERNTGLPSVQFQLLSVIVP